MTSKYWHVKSAAGEILATAISEKGAVAWIDRHGLSRGLVERGISKEGLIIVAPE